MSTNSELLRRKLQSIRQRYEENRRRVNDSAAALCDERADPFAMFLATETMPHFYDALMVAGQEISLGEKGSTIDAHGIAKGMPAEQIDSLIGFLDRDNPSGLKTERPLHTAPLDLADEEKQGGVTADGCAYRGGLFIIISEPGKTLSQHGIAHVLVNPVVKDLIPDLQKLYPQRSFMTYDEGTRFFGGESQSPVDVVRSLPRTHGR